jgi:ribulose 1,5-bisphosphate carboxylase large subunit-like protein
VDGHPDGTTEGAWAMVQAADAWKLQIPLKEYAKDYKELETALKLFGS